MPESRFRELLDMYLGTVAASSERPKVSFMETQRGGAGSMSPKVQAREDRIRALVKFFHTSLFECAEKVVDYEMAPVDGTPAPPMHQLRDDSLYYPYNLARKTAYEGFSDEQRQVIRGLILRTAFETMTRIAIRIEGISEDEVEIQLAPKSAPDLTHCLHDLDVDGHSYYDEQLFAELSKYEY